jgi:hypothetical protein
MADNMTEADKAKLSKMNAQINKMFEDILPRFPSYTRFGGLAYDDGAPVTWSLKDNQNLYRHWTDQKTKARYCYTPWKDTRGYYWSFVYAPRGPGSRSGNPERLIVTKGVKHRKRKAAKKRAYNLYAKATGKAAW